jgi:hypothetical protein
VGSSDVCAAQFQSKLAHWHPQNCGRQYVTCLVQQEAGKKESAFREAKLPSAHADAEDDA